MRPKARGNVCIPALLAVTTAAAPACGDDGKPTTTTSTTSTTRETTGSSGETDTTTGSTTVPTTSTTGTEAGSTTETGEVSVCEGLPDMAACIAEPGCVWATEFGACIADCAMFKDKPSCDMQDYCAWFGDTCELVVI